MKFNWYALVALIASGGLAAVVQALQNALPAETKVIANVAAIVVAVAAVILQFLQPAARISQDAPVVSSKGETIGINVSSTSTLPIAAPTTAAPPQGDSK